MKEKKKNPFPIMVVNDTNLLTFLYYYYYFPSFSSLHGARNEENSCEAKFEVKVFPVIQQECVSHSSLFLFLFIYSFSSHLLTSLLLFGSILSSNSFSPFHHVSLSHFPLHSLCLNISLLYLFALRYK